MLLTITCRLRAVLRLHYNKIIRGELHPKNILLHEHQILDVHGLQRGCYVEGISKSHGVISSKIFIANRIVEKNNLFKINQIMFDILNGKRENPIPNINDKFVSHYKKC
ncbi:kinase-like domain-containing protein [Rhizophagus clarus]|uniref:Kinase-like domain-containing protein n=1 Tax=Rhizophagus clarus TaxID=94130 RepID=A0A8H3R6D9_9GLOM|nr:kinase-like domain-containing protein [Rhizophagus clarus]